LVRHREALSGPCRAPVGLTLLTTVKQLSGTVGHVGDRVGCGHACVLSGTAGLSGCRAVEHVRACRGMSGHVRACRACQGCRVIGATTLCPSGPQRCVHRSHNVVSIRATTLCPSWPQRCVHPGHNVVSIRAHNVVSIGGPQRCVPTTLCPSGPQRCVHLSHISVSIRATRLCPSGPQRCVHPGHNVVSIGSITLCPQGPQRCVHRAHNGISLSRPSARMKCASGACAINCALLTPNLHLRGPFSTPLFHTPYRALSSTVKHCQAVGHYQALSGTVRLSGCRAVGRVLDSLTVLDRTHAW
jgi:hypothetical protein